MKKTIWIMILGVVIYLIYENTGIYLLINNNTSLIKKLEAKQYDDIDFKKVLEMIALQNNHEYDEFLLKVLQEKILLNVTEKRLIFSRCRLSVRHLCVRYIPKNRLKLPTIQLLLGLCLNIPISTPMKPIF